MKSIITVLGKDKVGIIAKVCIYLSNEGINIVDISQTIVSGIFNMVMVVELPDTDDRFDKIQRELAELGDDIGVIIKMQHEDIFNGMQRI